MTGRHPFLASQDPRKRDCVKCGLPESNPVHRVLASERQS